MEALAALFAVSAVSTAATAATAASGAAIGAGVAGAVSTAGVAATAATVGSTALTLLQGGLTAASVLSGVVGGIGALSQGMQAERMSRLQADQEQLAAEERALRIRRELVQKVAGNRVAFAGSGLDISGAKPLETALRDEAGFETSIEMNNARLRASQALARGEAQARRGAYDLTGSVLKGAGQVAGLGIDIAKRG